jgi:prepilin-type N-terminal cleavage/methylation domain-containing protein
MKLRRLHPPLAPRSDDGFGLIEVLVAVLILTVALLGLIGAFTSARKLTLLSEQRTSAAHRAQLEVERLQATPYSELLMTATPTHSAESTNPDFYVKAGPPPEYQYDTTGTGAEPLAIASAECTTLKTSCGTIATQPSGRSCSQYVGACEWKDGVLSGSVYDFVTWHTDKNCGVKCPTQENYKRLTVVVTLAVPSGARQVAPVRVSTLIAEPE